MNRVLILQLNICRLTSFPILCSVSAISISIVEWAKSDMVDTRGAIKIAKDTAREAGYRNAAVTDATYNEDDETFEVELEDDDVIINVTVDEANGEVVDFTTD